MSKNSNKLFFYNVLKMLNCKGKLLYFNRPHYIEEMTIKYKFLNIHLGELYGNHRFPTLKLKIGYMSISITDEAHALMYYFPFGATHSFANQIYYQIKVFDDIKFNKILLYKKNKIEYLSLLFFHSLNPDKLMEISKFLRFSNK